MAATCSNDKKILTECEVKEQTLENLCSGTNESLVSGKFCD